MPTLGDIVTLGQVALGASDATTTLQFRWGIVRAIDSYKSQRFSWNRKRWELTTTDGESYYTEIGEVDAGTTYEASEVFAIDSAFYLRDDVRFKLDVVDFEDRGLHLETPEDTGRPRAFAVGTESFLVYPEPDDEYVLQGVAVVDVNKTAGSYTEITTTSSLNGTNPWLDHADRMIFAKALAEVFLFYRRDPKWAAVYENSANQEFVRHVQDYERREGAGRVRGYHTGDTYLGYHRF